MDLGGRAGVTLIASAGLILTVAALAAMGDPYPVSRAGVARSGNSFAVENVVCPGDRLIDITLRRRNADGSSDELWHLTGDASVPSRLEFGETPDGMQSLVELSGPVDQGGSLQLRVRTSELSNASPMDFSPQDIPTDGIAGFGTTYAGRAEFSANVQAASPCGDPYRKAASGRRLAWVAVGSGCAALVGSGLLLNSRRRRSRTRANEFSV